MPRMTQGVVSFVSESCSPVSIVIGVESMSKFAGRGVDPLLWTCTVVGPEPTVVT